MRKIILVFLFLSLLFGLTSCNEKSEIRFFPETVKYNMHNASNEFGFNISVISSKQDPKIEFVSAKGINTEHLKVTFADETFESIKKRKIKGKYFIYLGVQCKAVSDYTKIEAMTVLVDGKETTISFPTPIEYTAFNRDGAKSYIYIINMPVYIFTQSFVGKNETDYAFSMEASENTKITTFKLNNFVDFSDDKVYVNNQFRGSIKEALPLELKKGDNLTVTTKIKSLTNENNGMHNLYFNIVVECEANGEKVTEYYPLVAVFLGNRDDAKEFVSYFSN